MEMSEENKYDIQDLISAGAEQRPTDFQTAFDSMIVDRIRDAVETRKIEIAQGLYNYDPEPEPENDDEFGAADLEEPEETHSEEE